MALSSLQALKLHLDKQRQNATLNLAYTSLSEEGVAEVAKFIRDIPFVKYVDLRGNSLKPKWAAMLAEGMKKNRSVRSINLKWNLIGKDPSGVAALCEMLKGNLSITQLDLRNNQINNKGAELIAEMLTVNKCISHLDLSWNDLGVDGGRALLEGLKRNIFVLECQLSGSRTGEETLHEVSFLLRRNRAELKERNAGLASKLFIADAKAPDDAKAETEAVAEDAEDAEDEAVRSQGLRAAQGIRTAKEASALMIQLLKREREQRLPEDKELYQRVAEHIDYLIKETAKHKGAAQQVQLREQAVNSGFLEREERYVKEIRRAEDILKVALRSKEDLLMELHYRQADLKRSREVCSKTREESEMLVQQAVEEDKRLRQELHAHLQDKDALERKLALLTKDIELVDEDSERFRKHVEKFQRDVKTIIADQ